MTQASENIDIYIEAVKLAQRNNQVVGEKSDYYVTLEQLERLLSREAGRQIRR